MISREQKGMNNLGCLYYSNIGERVGSRHFGICCPFFLTGVDCAGSICLRIKGEHRILYEKCGFHAGNKEMDKMWRLLLSIWALKKDCV